VHEIFLYARKMKYKKGNHKKGRKAVKMTEHKKARRVFCFHHPKV